MGDALDPTETYDGAVTVRVLRDEADPERVRCSSYEAAIDAVREAVPSATAVKIEDRDGDVVFTSAEMDIDDWAAAWRREKRSLSVDVEERDCPYDTVDCFADDLCVRCQMDRVRERF